MEELSLKKTKAQLLFLKMNHAGLLLVAITFLKVSRRKMDEERWLKEILCLEGSDRGIILAEGLIWTWLSKVPISTHRHGLYALLL